MEIFVNDEYSCLKSVVVSSAAYYDPTSLALNNETIKHYAQQGAVPTKEAILKEQKQFWQTLEKHGVQLQIAAQVDGAKGQMFTRDLAFAIGDKLFISNMVKENRKAAIQGWNLLLEQIDSRNLIKVPADIYLEGGDVLVDGKTIYVGISERTNMDGVNFLQKALGQDYTVIPLKLNPKFLHLDVVLTIINPKLMLIYKDGLKEESLPFLCHYNQIRISKQEQFELATNVLVLNPKTIIMNSHHRRIAEELKKLGFSIIPLDLSETAKDGGAFRCMTCPLKREERNDIYEYKSLDKGNEKI